MKWEESEMRFPTEWLRFASAAALVLGGVMSAQAQEIKLWTLNFANDSANQAFQSIIKQFQDANPGVTVKVENRGVDEHKSALRVAAGSDQGPDIFFSWAGLGLGGEFVKSGLALPMDKYYAEYKWDDRFLPVGAQLLQAISGRPVWNTVHLSRRGDLLQQVPFPEGRHHGRAEDLRRTRRRRG